MKLLDTYCQCFVILDDDGKRYIYTIIPECNKTLTPYILSLHTVLILTTMIYIFINMHKYIEGRYIYIDICMHVYICI
jgi:hypothetical protein